MPTKWFDDYVNGAAPQLQPQFTAPAESHARLFHWSMLIWSGVSLAAAGLLIDASHPHSAKNTLYIVIASLAIVLAVLIMAASAVALYKGRGYASLYNSAHNHMFPGSLTHGDLMPSDLH